MRKSRKPVRKCRKCPLNQGRYCWGYTYPRDQWRRGECAAFDNETAYSLFYAWQEDSRVKTLKQIRREAHRKGPYRPRSGLLEGMDARALPPGVVSGSAMSAARAAMREDRDR